MSALILALLACHDPVVDRWSPTREACDLAPGEIRVFPNEDLAAFDAPFVYTEACARAIGDDLGVDWAAFGDVALPGDFRGATLARLLAGGWLVLALDAGPAAELLEDPSSPEALRGQLEEIRDILGVGDDEPAARLAYEYVASRVTAVVPVEGDVNVSMVSPVGTLELPILYPDDHVYWWMDTLLHEAAHGDDRGHVSCSGAADETPLQDDSYEGAWGAAAFLVSRYRARLPEEYADELHPILDVLGRALCDGVQVPGDLYEYDEWE